MTTKGHRSPVRSILTRHVTSLSLFLPLPTPAALQPSAQSPQSAPLAIALLLLSLQCPLAAPVKQKATNQVIMMCALGLFNIFGGQPAT